jgi:hypothetical protein
MQGRVTFRLANDLREQIRSAHSHRLRNANLGVANRLSSQPLAAF